MKKRLVTVKNSTELSAKIDRAKKQIKNELTEDAAELRRSLLDMLDELAAAEVEIDEEELASRVRELIDAYNRDEENEVPASVANAIAKKMVGLQNSMPKSEKLTPAIKNQISAAILKARGREDIHNAVNAVLVKNGISGLEFEETVDYAISTNWGENNRLFNALRKTPFSKFFYSAQDVIDSGVQAHGWAKTSEVSKIVQAITALKKSIATQYIYKRQQVALEDLDDMREVNGETTFLQWLNDELDNQIVNTIIAVMTGALPLTGQGATDITTIEPLMGQGSTDAFRTAVTTAATAASGLEITDIRAIADAVANPYGKAKWLLIDQATLTQISAFVYASGGDTTYHRIDDLKGMLGVDEIYVTSLATTPIVFLPDGYWIKEKNSLEVVYPMWQDNIMNYQKERNVGGAVHDLKSVAFPDYAS